MWNVVLTDVTWRCRVMNVAEAARTSAWTQGGGWDTRERDGLYTEQGGSTET